MPPPPPLRLGELLAATLGDQPQAVAADARLSATTARSVW